MGNRTRAASLPEPNDAVEKVLAEYRRYLLCERGLRQTTVECYEPRARRFLADRREFDGVGLDRLTAADVTVFFARECPLGGAGRAQVLATAARSLLRYLYVSGSIAAPLEWAVPTVATLRGRSLPRGLEPAVVAALLSSCDRRRTVGRRDYAILLVLARLGLRAGEVAGIALENINWRAGELLVHGKGGRDDTLPLPVDVGAALASYLRRRPSGPEGCRRLFLTAMPPVEPMSRCAVSEVVRRACRRVGTAPVGAHQLRHALASEMLAAGASLAEIGQVLRHRERRTTAIYARVDRATLRALALPWPEVTA